MCLRYTQKENSTYQESFNFKSFKHQEAADSDISAPISVIL